MIQPGADEPSAAGPIDRSEPTALLDLTLWPHRSLPPSGYRAVLAIAALGLATPLFALAGQGGFWVVGAFCLADLALLAGLIALTYRSGRVRERLTLTSERLRVERVEPNGRRRVWEANPHWVRVRRIATPRVADYLVLSCAGRDVELGAFLAADERRTLEGLLRDGLARAAAATGPGRI